MRAQIQFSQIWHDFVTEAQPRTTIAQEDMTPEQRIEHSEGIARRHMGRQVTVSDMAESAGYHRAHFTALYQQLRGQSPRDFLRHLRLQEAKILLATQNLSISDIARNVDYPNASAFSRAVKNFHAPQVNSGKCIENIMKYASSNVQSFHANHEV